MLTRHRTAIEMLIAIVELCQNPIGKTELYYRMETSYAVLNHWIEKALNLHLIQNVPDRRSRPTKYEITQKGKDFLQTWKNLQPFLSAEEG